MNNKVANFLKTILGEYKDYNQAEFYYICPFCQRRDKKKKLAINLDKNNKSTYGHYHCWRCNERGSNLAILLQKVGAGNKIPELRVLVRGDGIDYNISNISDAFDAHHEKITKDLNLPKEFKSFKEVSNNPEYKNALMYLKNRNITAFDIAKHNIGYCDSGKYTGYIIIPSYNENMEVNYFVARRYYEGGMRYKNPDMSKNIVFNEIHINWNLPIILVEGVMDAIAVKRNAIPVLGHTIQSALRLKIFERKVRDIYLSFDKDVMKNSIDYVEEFMKNDINVYLVNLPQKDPSDVGFEEMVRLIKSAKKIEFSDLIQLKFTF